LLEFGWLPPLGRLVVLAWRCPPRSAIPSRIEFHQPPPLQCIILI
jgi:hypothetical protein